MSPSDKLTIVGIAVSIISNIVGWGITIWAAKKPSQTMLIEETPTPNPKQKKAKVRSLNEPMERVRLSLRAIFAGLSIICLICLFLIFSPNLNNLERLLYSILALSGLLISLCGFGIAQQAIGKATKRK